MSPDQLRAYVQQFSGFDMSIHNLVNKLANVQASFKQFGLCKKYKEHLEGAQREIDSAMDSIRTLGSEAFITDGTLTDPVDNSIQGRLRECTTKANSLHESGLVSRFAEVYFSDKCKTGDGSRVISMERKGSFEADISNIQSQLNDIKDALAAVAEAEVGAGK
jgi:hypothetical protein